MQDREMTTDLLQTQKKATSDYNNCASESAHMEVKRVFMDLLEEEQNIADQLFCKMNARGWYPTEEAPEDKRNDAREQFKGCACSCGCGVC